MTKEQLADIRRRAERDSGSWTGIVGEAIYDRRKLLAELDHLSRIEDKYVNLCPVLNELEAEVQRLQQALAFWLPHVPSSGSERAERCGDDAMLLVGYAGRLDPDAEYLGWITF